LLFFWLRKEREQATEYAIRFVYGSRIFCYLRLNKLKKSQKDVDFPISNLSFLKSVVKNQVMMKYYLIEIIVSKDQVMHCTLALKMKSDKKMNPPVTAKNESYTQCATNCGPHNRAL